MGKIRAIIKRPDELYGHVTNISNTLENLQRTVEGYIETVPFGENVLIVNEEGKLRGLEPNIKVQSDVLVGTVVLVGIDGEELADCTLDFGVWKRWLDNYGRYPG